MSISDALTAALERRGITIDPKGPETEPEESLPETVAVEPETDDEAAIADAGDGEPGGETNAPEEYTVQSLAEAIGWQPADLYGVKVPLGDGEALTVGELKDKWIEIKSSQEQVKTQLADIQAQRAAIEQQNARGPQLSQAVIEAVGQLQAIDQQYKAVDWDGLRKSNVAQYAAARQDFAAARAEAVAAVQTAQMQAHQEHSQRMADVHRQHAGRLVDLVPEWKDPKMMQTEAQQVKQYLLDRGFSEPEIQSIYHSSAHAVARDGWLWSQHQKDMSSIKEQVRQAPKKVIKPGAGGDQKTNQARIAALSQKAIQSGRQDDRLAAARAIVSGSRK